MPTPWLSWPLRLASTRWSAMTAASSSLLPAAAKTRRPMRRNSAGSTTGIRDLSNLGGALRRGGIDAQNLHLVREKPQLLERQLQRAVVGMRLDIGVELGRGEAPLDHVAFELGHVDGVGGEPAERLVERGRHVANVEDKGGDRRP